MTTRENHQMIPTFTYDTFNETHLGVAEHDVDLEADGSSDLMQQFAAEGIEIDSPYEQFFSDGEPPKLGGA